MNSLKYSATATQKEAIQKEAPGELLLAIAMLLNSLAVSLMIKADFGISAISSVPYVFLRAFPYRFHFRLYSERLDWTFAAHERRNHLAFCLLYCRLSAHDRRNFLFLPVFLCGTPVLPFDTVSRAFVMEKGLSVRKARTGFDLVNLALSAAVSLIFVGRINGIGAGTLVSALLMGTVAGKVTAWMKAHFLVRPYFSVLGRLV